MGRNGWIDYVYGTLVLTWEEMDGWVVYVWDFSLDVMGRNGWIDYVCGTLVLTWEEMDGWVVCV